jgi:membrane associated rhomboid family serine protease
MKLRGLPWVTLAILVLCIVVFGLTAGPSGRAAMEAERLFGEIAEIYLAHPGLEIDPAFQEMVFQSFGVDDNQREVFLESLKRQSASRAGDGARPSQREIDALIDRFWSTIRGSPHYRFGVVPSDISATGLVTYQFLHGGWAHLIGNLLFLFLAGPHLEQRWGRPAFLVFYLVSGIVAALFWALRYPDLDAPLVGASGSIAGLMGAFLICFWSSKIRFFYWFVVAWGTFEAPAWLMLPLWLVIEVISGRTMDVLSQGDGGGGVAHWAHVWGFIFGMVVAWGLGVIGVDRKLAARNGAATVSEPEPSPPRRGEERPGGPSVLTGATDPEPAFEASHPEPALPTPDPVDLVEPPTAPDAPLTPIELSSSGSTVVEIRPAERLRVLEAVPRGIDDGHLIFQVPEGRRRLELAKTEGVAVGAVAESGRRPYLVIDLLLDSPADGEGDLRVIRFRSTGFDPRTIVGGEQSMEAFVRLVHRLEREAGAPVLPEADIAGDPSARLYRSIEEYQGEVLGVMG